MKNLMTIAVIAFSGLSFFACASDPGRSGSRSSTYHQGTSAAESACMAAVNRQYGGRERNLRVINSEFSQAGSLVMVAADGERWRCLASNDGAVEELSRATGRGAPAARGSIGNLVGMNARNLGSEMARLGFHNVNGYKTNEATVSYWWNAGSRQCLYVETRQGRVSKAGTIAEAICR